MESDVSKTKSTISKTKPFRNRTYTMTSYPRIYIKSFTIERNWLLYINTVFISTNHSISSAQMKIISLKLLTHHWNNMQKTQKLSAYKGNKKYLVREIKPIKIVLVG